MAPVARGLRHGDEPVGGPWTVDLAGVTRLDTAGALVLDRYLARLRRSGTEPILVGLHTEHASMLELVRLDTRPATPPPRRQSGILERLGRETALRVGHALGFLDFLGRLAVDSVPRLLRLHRLRWRQVAAELQRAGVHALPITGLLAFLMGLVIAYQGGSALSTFGAGVFLVDLVAITMLREMAPLLTAIIIAGRTGSSYAAQIGTMRLTEEVDALRSLGITPFEILVLPKLLAMIVAVPLLTVWADALGLLGGMVVADTLHGIGYTTFLERLPDAVYPTTFWVGLVKTPVFALLIATVGCYQGFRVRGSAEEVGRSTTASVVQAIFLVIVADALFSIAFERVGL